MSTNPTGAIMTAPPQLQNPQPQVQGPQEGMNVPFSVEPMPTPIKQQNVVVGAEEPAIAPQPSGAGWMGTTGKVADVATNFLHGFLQGRLQKQQQMLQGAQNEVQGAAAAKDVTMSAFNSLVQNGVTPDDPRYQQAQSAAKQAWDGYVNSMAKYATPTDAKGNPIQPAQGVMGKVKGALQPSMQAMYPQMAISALKQADPVAAIVQTAQNRAAQAQANTTEAQSDSYMKSVLARDNYSADVDAYNETLKGQDKDAQTKAWAKLSNGASQLSTYGIKVEAPDLPGQAAAAVGKVENEQQLNSIKSSGLQKLQNGQTLTAAESAALGRDPKELYQVFFNKIGMKQPDGTTYTADNAAHDVEVTQERIKASAEYAYGNAQVRVMQAREGNGSQMMDRTLDMLRQAHPDWNDTQITEEALRTHPWNSRGGGAASPERLLPWQDADRERAGVMNSIATSNPEYAPYLTTKDNKGNTVSNWNPKAGQGFMGIGGVDQATRLQTVQDIWDKGQAMLQQTRTPAQIQQILGPRPGTIAPKGGPASSAQITPPPAAPPAKGAGGLPGANQPAQPAFKGKWW